MQWQNSNVEKKVKSELEDLTSVLEIISQLSKPEANRILQYCLNYVNDTSNISNIPVDISSIEEKSEIMAKLFQKFNEETKNELNKH